VSEIEAKEMASKRPTTIAEYIRSAPAQGRPNLWRLYAILKSVAPKAKEAIKWGMPFFIEPRFLFAFSAHKAHCNLASTPSALKAFAEELQEHKTTKNFLQLPYNQPLPENLIRKIARYRLGEVAKRDDDSFW